MQRLQEQRSVDAPGETEKLLITNQVTTDFYVPPCTPMAYASFSHPTEVSRLKLRNRGFTLIELLVVLVIIGIMASFAVLQFGNRGDDLVTEESGRLKTLVRVAREEAILQGREYGLGFSAQSYAFYTDEEENGEWLPTQGDPALRERLIPEALKLSLVLEDQLLELEKELPKKPHVFIYSSGEITPFALSFRIEEFDAEPVEIKFDALGRNDVPPS